MGLRRLHPAGQEERHLRQEGHPLHHRLRHQGSYGWARSSGTPQKGKCASDGKALTFGFQNSAHDYVSFNFYGAKGVQDEVPDATVLKILGTVRLHGTPTSD